MRNFTYLRPDTIEEALQLLDEHTDDAKILAGGQSLVLLLREGLLQPEVLIDISGVPGLDRISLGEDGRALSIGALATHRSLELSPIVAEHFPVFQEAYATLASPPVRNLATLGGNLTHNAPGSDPPPLLVTYEAVVTLKSSQGERQLSVLDFGTDYYETDLGEDEILTEISVPLASERSAVAYQKFAIRPMDMAIVGVAARIDLAEDRQTCRRALVALSGVAQTTIRSRPAEAGLAGERYHPDLVAAVAQATLQDIDPTSDIHASSEYRRNLTPIAVQRVITKAWQQVLAG